MSERLARVLLRTYRWGGWAIYPVVGRYVAKRTRSGTVEASRRRERSGRATKPRPEGPVIWVHAAGDAETLAMIPMVRAFLGNGISVVMTTSAATSGDIIAERLGERVIHQYVPVDLKPAIGRFLEHWRPDLAVFAESEIWPMTLLELGVRRIPHVLVNGRMSDRAFATWQRYSGIAEAIFESFALVVAQSETDAERYRALGARPVNVSGNLKLDTMPPPVDELELRRIQNDLAGRPRWAAIATVAGEEALAAEAHQLLQKRYPDLLTVMVPQDPNRAAELEIALTAMGLNVSRRSRGDKITSKTHVLIGDTVRESGLYLRLAQIVFMGNSLAGAGGGTNPLDAAMLRAAVLSGPACEYHKEFFQPLVEAGGVRLVRDRDMLAGAVNFLLKNEPARAQIGAAAAACVQRLRGPLDLTIRHLDPYVHPLVVKSRLSDETTRKDARATR